MFDKIKGGINAIFDKLSEQWLDFALWATDERTHAAGSIFLMIAILFVTCVILSSVMIYRRPQTGLERALLLREISKAYLFAFFLYAFHYGDRPVLWRVSSYAVAMIFSLVVIFFVLKETLPHKDESRYERLREMYEDQQKHNREALDTAESARLLVNRTRKDRSESDRLLADRIFVDDVENARLEKERTRFDTSEVARLENERETHA